jgi:uncharacterized protein YwgA
MNLEDAILRILDFNGEYGAGRTTMQKLLYFASEKGAVGIGFMPHYYGPYSGEVSTELSNLVSLGFVEENAAAFSSGNVGYVYRITDDGREILDGDEKSVRIIEKLVEVAKRHFALNQSLLAIAAKTHFILKKNGSTMTFSAIRTEALRLGWKVSPEDIEKVLGFLSELELISRAE